MNPPSPHTLTSKLTLDVRAQLAVYHAKQKMTQPKNPNLAASSKQPGSEPASAKPSAPTAPARDMTSLALTLSRLGDYEKGHARLTQLLARALNPEKWMNTAFDHGSVHGLRLAHSLLCPGAADGDLAQLPAYGEIEYLDDPNQKLSDELARQLASLDLQVEEVSFQHGTQRFTFSDLALMFGLDLKRSPASIGLDLLGILASQPTLQRELLRLASQKGAEQEKEAGKPFGHFPEALREATAPTEEPAKAVEEVPPQPEKVEPARDAPPVTVIGGAIPPKMSEVPVKASVKPAEAPIVGKAKVSQTPKKS